jgi:hypothetical protein
MSATNKNGLGVLCLLASSLAWGCARNTAPSGWLSPAPQASREAYGGWAMVSDSAGAQTSGELIAVTRDSVYLLSSVGLTVVSMRTVAKLNVTGYNAQPSAIALWGLAGTLGTISHGFLLIFSAPVWIITSSIAASAHSREPREIYPGVGLDQLRIYARFPQGIPAGVDRAQLRPKPAG